MSGAETLGTATARAWRGLAWYLKELSGESKWDEHVAHCQAHGHAPLSRREFERRRSELAERNPATRCC